MGGVDSTVRVRVDMHSATAKLKEFRMNSTALGNTLQQTGQKGTQAFNQISVAATKAGQTATTAAVGFQTMGMGMLNLSTSAVQTFTSLSNLDRVQNRAAASAVGLQRAQDLLARKQVQLIKLQEAGNGAGRDAVLITKEITTATNDLAVKTDKLNIEQAAVTDVYMLFFANIANVGISTMMIMSNMMSASTKAMIMDGIATHKNTLSKYLRNTALGQSVVASAAATSSTVTHTMAIGIQNIAVTKLTWKHRLLNIARGPIGWAILAAGAVATIAMTAAMMNETKATEAATAGTIGFGSAVDGTTGAINDQTNALNNQTDALNKQTMPMQNHIKNLKDWYRSQGDLNSLLELNQKFGGGGSGFSPGFGSPNTNSGGTSGSAASLTGGSSGAFDSSNSGSISPTVGGMSATQLVPGSNIETAIENIRGNNRNKITSYLSYNGMGLQVKTQQVGARGGFKNDFVKPNVPWQTGNTGGRMGNIADIESEEIVEMIFQDKGMTNAWTTAKNAGPKSAIEMLDAEIILQSNPAIKQLLIDKKNEIILQGVVEQNMKLRTTHGKGSVVGNGALMDAAKFIGDSLYGFFGPDNGKTNIQVGGRNRGQSTYGGGAVESNYMGVMADNMVWGGNNSAIVATGVGPLGTFEQRLTFYSLPQDQQEGEYLKILGGMQKGSREYITMWNKMTDDANITDNWTNGVTPDSSKAMDMKFKPNANTSMKYTDALTLRGIGGADPKNKLWRDKIDPDGEFMWAKEVSQSISFKKEEFDGLATWLKDNPMNGTYTLNGEEIVINRKADINSMGEISYAGNQGAALAKARSLGVQSFGMGNRSRGTASSPILDYLLEQQAKGLDFTKTRTNLGRQSQFDYDYMNKYGGVNGGLNVSSGGGYTQSQINNGANANTTWNGRASAAFYAANAQADYMANSGMGNRVKSAGNMFGVTQQLGMGYRSNIPAPAHWANYAPTTTMARQFGSDEIANEQMAASYTEYLREGAEHGMGNQHVVNRYYERNISIAAGSNARAAKKAEGIGISFNPNDASGYYESRRGSRTVHWVSTAVTSEEQIRLDIGASTGAVIPSAARIIAISQAFANNGNYSNFNNVSLTQDSMSSLGMTEQKVFDIRFNSTRGDRELENRMRHIEQQAASSSGTSPL